MKLVLDTSIIIDNLRGGTIWRDTIDDIESKGTELFLPTVVLFEIFSGKSTNKKATIDELDLLLNKFQRVDLSEKIAVHAGKLLRNTGSHIDPIDYIIAASALEVGAEVFTLNTKHFEKIPGLRLYKF